ncbi:MAG: hypothetical protein ACFB4J_10575 [Elainellaceae cyanobacterium]
MFIFYALPAALTFAVLLQAFYQDDTTPLSDIDSWLVLILASALWPIAAMLRLRHGVNQSHEPESNLALSSKAT